MHLIIFDIDGTIIDSVDSDDACYVQAFEETFDIDLPHIDWDNFTDVTDSGISRDIFLQSYDRLPTELEIGLLKERYYNLLRERVPDIRPIEGAESFINYLERENQSLIAFATGGWKKTALLKSSVTTIDIRRFVHKTSDDHYNRAEILTRAINQSRIANNGQSFDKIISIGDGIWDMTTAAELGVEFIGIDYNLSGKLKSRGAQRVAKDFKDRDQWLKWVS